MLSRSIPESEHNTLAYPRERVVHSPVLQVNPVVPSDPVLQRKLSAVQNRQRNRQTVTRSKQTALWRFSSLIPWKNTFWQKDQLFVVLLSCALCACNPPDAVPPDTNAKVERTTISVVENRSPEVVMLSSLSEKRPGVVDRGEGLIRPKRFEAHGRVVSGLILSEKEDVAYSAGHDGLVLKHTLRGEGKVQSVKLLSSSRPISAIALSPDETRLAVAAYSYIMAFDLSGNQVEAELTRVKGRITHLEWDPQGKLLAFGTARGSVFIWNPKRGNSLEGLERYLGLSSPVVGLGFHPSGRTLFAAERASVISVFRILRTEFEMGLRDDQALADQSRSFRRDSAARVQTSRLIGFELDDDLLFGWGAEGAIDIFKIRGLALQDRIQAAGEAIQGFATLRVNSLGKVIATAGRDSVVRFWCRVPKRKRYLAPEGTEIATPTFDSQNDPRFLASSVILDEPVDRLVSSGRGLLWAAQKNGSLLIFNSDRLYSLPSVRSRFRECQ